MTMRTITAGRRRMSIEVITVQAGPAAARSCGVIFVDLPTARLLQVVFDPDRADVFAMAERVRNEYVSRSRAWCAHGRGNGQRESEIRPGRTAVHELEILNRSEPCRFSWTRR